MKKVSALSSFWLMLLSRDGCDRDSGLVFLELWQNTQLRPCEPMPITWNRSRSQAAILLNCVKSNERGAP
jgi:hypothetical protein